MEGIMSKKIISIELSIQTLDAGTFQKLCDEIVSKKYPKYLINCLGSKAGSEKITKGTPDTFFHSSKGKFIFVEYTTKIGSSSELMQKIESDIDKCFDEDKTGIKLNQIEKIVYFHTSSNLSPENISFLNEKCSKKGINFEINGINQIAREICENYPWLSSSYLGIPIDTEQFFDYNEFIQKYDSNKTAAPLNMPLCFREKEQKNIISALAKNVVIIKGKAGVGKTKLALHCARKYSEENKYQLYCVRNNNLSVFEDLKKYILPNEKCILLVDDANSFDKNEIQHFLKLIDEPSFEVKVIFTVRDSLFSPFFNECRKFCVPEIIEVNSFDDTEIKEIMKSNLGILNDDYLEQIVRISEGNIRLAYLSGKCALEKQNLHAIKNAEKLFEKYYDVFFNDIELNDDEILKTLGIIAFYKNIDTKKLSDYEDLFSLVNLNEVRFNTICQKLMQFEIIDKSFDQYLKIAEQCLENYFLYIFLFKKKYVQLSKIISCFFHKRSFSLIASLNSIVPIFYSDELINYMAIEVRNIWDEMISVDHSYDFVKGFGSLYLDGTLLFLKKMINKSEQTVIDLNNIDLSNRNLYFSDKILELLKLFAETELVNLAIELLCEYIKRNQHCFVDAYYLIEEAFLPNRYSYENSYYKENIVLDTILAKCDSEVIQMFFLYISNFYLSLVFRPAEQGRRNTVIISTIVVQSTEEVLLLRKKIWEKLIFLLANKLYTKKVIQVVEDYASSGWSEEICVDLLKKDLQYVTEIIQKICCYDWIKGIYIQKNLNNRLKHFNLDIVTKDILNIDDEKYEIFNLFAGKDYPKKQFDLNMKKFLEKNPVLDFENLIKTIDLFIKKFPDKDWQINYNLTNFFNLLNDSQILPFIKAYIRYGQNFQISTYRNISFFVSKLFTILDKSEVYEFIKEKVFFDKNLWLFSYYSDMPQKHISEKEYKDFLSFFDIELKDDCLKNGLYRKINFIENYLRFDNEVFVKLYSKLFLLKEKSKNSYYYYLTSLFLSDVAPTKLFMYFKTDLKLLSNLYFDAYKQISHIDYDNKYFYYFLQNSDDFKFQFINYIIGELISYRDIPYNFFDIWNLDNSEFIILYILDSVYKEYTNSFCSVEKLKGLFIAKNGDAKLIKKQNSFLLNIIESKICDKNYLLFLFNIIKEFNNDRKQIFIQKILELNISFSIFSELKFNSSIEMSHGSFSPNIKAKITLWKNIQSSVKKTIDNIEHFDFISKKINSLERALDEELKRNYLDSIFL